jgi:hypothetical protein
VRHAVAAVNASNTVVAALIDSRRCPSLRVMAEVVRRATPAVRAILKDRSI